jgi:peptidoglycan/LPS O-acetylase OafA/YrhL
LAIAGAIGLLRRAHYVLVGYLVFLAAYWLVVESNHVNVTSHTAFEFVLLVTWFVGGALAWHFRHLVVGRHPFLLPVAGLLVVGWALHSSLLILPTVSWLIIYVGTLPARYRKGMATAGNLSYGVYLYAWPVQQTLYWLGVSHNAWVISALTTPITLGLGCASWNLIEKRGIAHGRAPWPSLPVLARNPLRRKVSAR